MGRSARKDGDDDDGGGGGGVDYDGGGGDCHAKRWALPFRSNQKK